MCVVRTNCTDAVAKTVAVNCSLAIKFKTFNNSAK